ncbi:hypothetical protein [Spiroplasma floricola]|uniref:Uncharacterized protein n=1 Tax=Spiroplasma floricola 23-6 TaxID=1336749 RepID=A0A2K8SCN2_9MOLU|nr:hypothetical protein [Spiroplasma floricola]AUB31231.1 hypothetical protein SFLOR_v1c01700 [Spiroplasma floricola 23-6]
MKKIRIWRIIITSIVSISLIAIIPWITVHITDEKLSSVTFSLKNTYLINWVILASGVFYFIITLLSNVLRNNTAKIFSVFSTILSFIIILILSLYYYLIISYTMPLFCLLSIDSVLSIISVSIKPATAEQKVQTAVQSQQQVQDNSRENSPNINTTEAKDVSELKNKILSMKSGLNKSYEEAVNEIEMTGALNGLDMSELLNESQDEDQNKIIPFSIGEQKNNINSDFNRNKELVSSADENLIIQDPLANFSSDYEDTQPSNLLDKNYKYTSRRKDVDDNKN